MPNGDASPCPAASTSGLVCTAESQACLPVPCARLAPSGPTCFLLLLPRQLEPCDSGTWAVAATSFTFTGLSRVLWGPPGDAPGTVRARCGHLCWFGHKWPVALPLADATLLPFPERRLPPQVSVGETARPQQKRH